jgi:hypothetical protein
MDRQKLSFWDSKHFHVGRGGCVPDCHLSTRCTFWKTLIRAVQKGVGCEAQHGMECWSIGVLEYWVLTLPITPPLHYSSLPSAIERNKAGELFQQPGEFEKKSACS